MGDKLVELPKDVRNLYRGIRFCSTITRGEEEREERRRAEKEEYEDEKEERTR